MEQKNRPPVMIDQPTPYDSLETWESHLVELEALPKGTPLKFELIKQAEDEIKARKPTADPAPGSIEARAAERL